MGEGTGGRRGALLLELLLGLTLAVMVFGAFVGVLVSGLRWTGALVQRAEGLEVVRTVWVVLEEELRPGLEGRDWWADGDVVDLRAFRGMARVCGPGREPGQWVVGYRGRRLPDPARDSVLVLGVDGGWRAFDLEDVIPAEGCAADEGERGFEWRWHDRGSPSPVLVRSFERGEYHLADGALRYRRGLGGRQPLTPERVGPESRFEPLPGGGLEVHLDIVAGGVQGGSLPPFTWRVGGGWLDDGLPD